ncbi:hypothetical protein MUP00_00610 [Candidatus Bathyarchaeota archaeon]|nr:hypothetical protein [Candidatus Bathyarchaeota archaeon]
MASPTRQERTSRYIFSVSREFLTFWGVMFFTGVVGIVELLPEIDYGSHSVQYSFFGTLLHFGLVALMILSLRNCFRIVKDSSRLTREGALGEDYRKFALEHPSDVDNMFFKDGVFQSWRANLLQVGVVIFFTLLFLAKAV